MFPLNRQSLPSTHHFDAVTGEVVHKLDDYRWRVARVEQHTVDHVDTQDTQCLLLQLCCVVQHARVKQDRVGLAPGCMFRVPKPI